MRWRRCLAAVLLLLGPGGTAFAHRLDEYLQATIVSVEKTQARGSMRLIPGVAVASAEIAGMDRNGDGILSGAEQRAYAEQVLDGLSLTVDGASVRPRLVAMAFPPIAAMREGVGEIHLEWVADLPRGGPGRRLVLENLSRSSRPVYLVNARVPSDPAIRILAQRRNEAQSLYELDYEQSGAVSGMPSENPWRRMQASLGAIGFTRLFRLGMRHIAEGTDHLLFLLTLLLPAPLLVLGSRWHGVASVRESLGRILKIVTAFTLGHSMTLALVAAGWVHAASRPVELLVAMSISLSAIHALRPIFPGKEAGIAAFFGLIHGLAFAATLGSLGFGGWDRFCGVLAFNLGIETMQMAVVLVTLPSLLLLSRTRVYPMLRMGGAVFAGVASVGWMAERMFGVRTAVDVVVSAAARQASWMAGVLFLVSLGAVLWRLPRGGRMLGWGRGVR